MILKSVGKVLRDAAFVWLLNRSGRKSGVAECLADALQIKGAPVSFSAFRLYNQI